MSQDPTCPPIVLFTILAIFAITILLEDIKIKRKK
jgi:hypothetical protein